MFNGKSQSNHSWERWSPVASTSPDPRVPWGRRGDPAGLPCLQAGGWCEGQKEDSSAEARGNPDPRAAGKAPGAGAQAALELRGTVFTCGQGEVWCANDHCVQSLLRCARVSRLPAGGSAAVGGRLSPADLAAGARTPGGGPRVPSGGAGAGPRGAGRAAAGGVGGLSSRDAEELAPFRDLPWFSKIWFGFGFPFLTSLPVYSYFPPLLLAFFFFLQHQLFSVLQSNVYSL